MSWISRFPNSGMLKFVKLLNVAGAYWKGDAERKYDDSYLWSVIPQKRKC